MSMSVHSGTVASGSLHTFTWHSRRDVISSSAADLIRRGLQTASLTALGAKPECFGDRK
jgi:hypothetical protein